MVHVRVYIDILYILRSVERIVGVCWWLDVSQLDHREHLFDTPVTDIPQPPLDVLKMLKYTEVHNMISRLLFDSIMSAIEVWDVHSRVIKETCRFYFFVATETGAVSF